MRIIDRILLIMMSFMLLLMVSVIASFAYFQITETHGITVSSGTFDVEFVVKFNDQIVTVDSPYYDKERGKE